MKLEQSWSEFYNDVGEYPVVLFGIGKKCESYLNEFGYLLKIEGFCDNSPKKIGKKISQVFTNTSYNHFGEKKIITIDELYKKENLQHTILLVTTKYDDQIIEQLKREKFYKVYSIAKMDNMLYADLKAFESLPICNSKIVVFMSYLGGHGRAITEQLIRKNINLDIVWLVDEKPSYCPSGIRIIYRYCWDSYYYEIYTAKIWIVDESVYAHVKKKIGQIYIQVKHWSSLTLKAFNACEYRFTKIPGALERQLMESKRTDYIFSGSDFDEESCRKGFLYDGKFVRVGSPRSDILFYGRNEDIYKRLNFTKNKKIVLYAPTFRVKKDNLIRYEYRDQKIDYELLLKTLNLKFGGEWVVFLRLHPSINSELLNDDLPANVIDVSKYGDSEELVAICDALISDYSSIVFEASYVYKPVFLFTTDLDEYLSTERKLLLNYKTLPFDIADTNEQLSQNIVKFNYTDYKNKLDKFFNKYNVHEDGKASKRAAEFILNLLEDA